MGCTAKVRLLGTDPVVYRHCIFPTADGEHKCARHGGRPIHKRRARSLVRTLRAWLKREGWTMPKRAKLKEVI